MLVGRSDFFVRSFLLIILIKCLKGLQDHSLPYGCSPGKSIIGRLVCRYLFWSVRKVFVVSFRKYVASHGHLKMTKTQTDFLTFSTLRCGCTLKLIVLGLLRENLSAIHPLLDLNGLEWTWLDAATKLTGFSLKRLKLSQHFPTKLLRAEKN